MKISHDRPEMIPSGLRRGAGGDDLTGRPERDPADVEAEQNAPRKRRRHNPAMLAMQQDNSRRQHEVSLVVQLAGRCGTKVGDGADGRGPNDVAFLPEPAAPVDLLAEEKELLIEKPYFANGAAAQAHEAAADEIHILCVGSFQRPQLAAGEKSRRRQFPQAAGEHRKIQKTREAAAAGLRRAVLVQHTTPQNSNVLMALHVGNRVCQNVTMNQRIGIEKQDVFAGGALDRLIVGGGEAAIVGIPDQDHVRKFPLDHLRRSVAGAVVDNKNLQIQRPAVVLLAAGENAAEAVPKQLPCVPVDNNDGKIHVAWFRCAGIRWR